MAMFGGGGFDAQNQFAGGGFMPTQANSQGGGGSGGKVCATPQALNVCGALHVPAAQHWHAHHGRIDMSPCIMSWHSAARRRDRSSFLRVAAGVVPCVVCCSTRCCSTRCMAAAFVDPTCTPSPHTHTQNRTQGRSNKEQTLRAVTIRQLGMVRQRGSGFGEVERGGAAAHLVVAACEDTVYCHTPTTNHANRTGNVQRPQ